MLERKIFFTDLDATLLTDDKMILDGSRRTLEEMLRREYPVVFCTGRVLHSAAVQVRRIGFYLPGCYLICYNGGQVFEIAGEKILYSNSLSADLVAACFRTAAEEDVHIQAYAGFDAGTVLARRPSPHLDSYCAVQKLEQMIVEDVTAHIGASTPKMLAIETDREKMDRFREKVHARVGDRVDLFMSSNTYLELVPPGINKGNAVRFLCEHLGIPVENSVAAGDAENDISMLQAAGVGAAVANAQDAVKASADYVSDLDNNHDAVAQILEKFVLV